MFCQFLLTVLHVSELSKLLNFVYLNLVQVGHQHGGENQRKPTHVSCDTVKINYHKSSLHTCTIFKIATISIKNVVNSLHVEMS